MTRLLAAIEAWGLGPRRRAVRAPVEITAPLFTERLTLQLLLEEDDVVQDPQHLLGRSTDLGKYEALLKGASKRLMQGKFS